MNETNEAELRPLLELYCPICKRELESYYDFEKGHEVYFCNDSCEEGYRGHFGSDITKIRKPSTVAKTNAIAAWNTRHQRSSEQVSIQLSEADSRCPACGLIGLHYCAGNPVVGGPQSYSKQSSEQTDKFGEKVQQIAIELRDENHALKAELAALKEENQTFRNAQKACDDCDAPTMKEVAALKEQALEAGDKLKVALVNVADLKERAVRLNDWAEQEQARKLEILFEYEKLEAKLEVAKEALKSCLDGDCDYKCVQEFGGYTLDDDVKAKLIEALAKMEEEL